MAEFGATEVSQLTSGLSDQQKSAFTTQYDAVKKDPQMIFLLAILVGSLGVDRFLLDDMKMGVIKLLTGGGCGILWIMDILSAKERTNAFNKAKADAIIATL
jgi:TM2 domain-containing membrane protein YozV